MDCEEIPGILCVRVWWRKSTLPRGPGLAWLIVIPYGRCDLTEYCAAATPLDSALDRRLAHVWAATASAYSESEHICVLCHRHAHAGFSAVTNSTTLRPRHRSGVASG